MTQWWRVTPPTLESNTNFIVSPWEEFSVLVVDGRVAVDTQRYGLISIGEPWKDARGRLEKALFMCVMVAS
jgi:hypothetical protein